MSLDALRRTERDANRALSAARTALEMAENHNERCAGAVADWKGGRGQNESREPRFTGDAEGGMVWTDAGLARPDIAMSPPVEADRVEELRSDLDDTQKAHDAAWAELREAVSTEAVDKVDRSTGFAARKMFLFDGRRYEPGEAIDPETIALGNWDKLLSQRFVIPVR